MCYQTATVFLPHTSCSLSTLPEIRTATTGANPPCFKHSSGTKKWKQDIKLIKSVILKAVVSARRRCREQQIFCDSFTRELASTAI